MVTCFKCKLVAVANITKMALYYCLKNAIRPFLTEFNMGGIVESLNRNMWIGKNHEAEEEVKSEK